MRAQQKLCPHSISLGTKGVKDMYRGKRLVIRLNRVERATINKLAAIEQLPASTLARRLLLQEADKRGLWPADQHSQQLQPQAGEVRGGD